MTPAQHSAYLAVCEADQNCVCSLAIELMPGDEKHCWGEALSNPNDLMVAASLVTDHLHTRLEMTELAGLRGYSTSDHKWVLHDDHGNDVLRTPSKLNALLAAHVVRLSLPRELIQKMEEA